MSERGEIPVDVGVAKKQEKQVSSESFLEPILNKPLTVERIDNYADDAVNELIFLLNQKVDDYKSGHNTGGWDDKSIENAALRFYGLENVSSYLDFLAEKDAEIRGLDKVIKKARQTYRVIVSPDSYDPHVGSNGGEMAEKKMISRVKTVLFILKEDFEVDVDDERQLFLKEGVVRDNMMRKTSYFLISAPKIDRTLLVCDEEGNVSYVFNNKVLKDKGISEDVLINSTKEELNELIQQTPELGKRVIYSKDFFVPRMVEAIRNPDSIRPDEVTKEMKDLGKYLYQEPTGGELSLSGVAKKLGIVDKTLKKVIDAMDPQELGGVNLRRFKGNVTGAYSLEQQEKILKQVEMSGLLSSEPTNGELSINGLAEKLGIASRTLQKVIDSMDPQELGGVNLRRFKGNVTGAYSLEQQEKILKQVEMSGLLSSEPTNGELSINGLAEKLGVAYVTVQKIIDSMDPSELGEIRLRKFVPIVTKAYTPEQQEKIIQKGEAMGKIAPEPVNGELSNNGFAKKLGLSWKMVQKNINAVNQKSFGIVGSYRFGVKVRLGYTLEQQWMVIDYIKEHKKNLISKEKWKELDEEKKKWMESKSKE